MADAPLLRIRSGEYAPVLDIELTFRKQSHDWINNGFWKPIAEKRDANCLSRNKIEGLLPIRKKQEERGSASFKVLKEAAD